MEKFCTTTNSCFLGISDVENVQMEQGANSRSAIQQILDEIELAPVYRSTFKKKYMMQVATFIMTLLAKIQKFREKLMLN